MKKMMILASAIMMALAVNAQNNEFDNASSIAPFNGIKVNVPARVRVVYGEEYGMRIQAADSFTRSALRYRVENGVLTISARDEQEIEEIENLCITIFSPVEQEVSAGRNMLIQKTPERRENRDLAAN